MLYQSFRPTIAALAIAALLLAPLPQARAESAPGELPTPLLAVAKVATYYADQLGDLMPLGTGSGVVISKDGLLLTNRHVVVMEETLDSKIRPTGVSVCLPRKLNAEPECDYTAELIAESKDLDVALLRISPILGAGRPAPYPAIDWDVADLTLLNTAVFVAGYPGIGGKTLTVTQGAVSGKVEQGSRLWLKVDAVTSYGNSGGATMSGEGRLFGITSAASADYLGSLGYVLSMQSVHPWIARHRDGAPVPSALTARVAEFAQLQKKLKEGNDFQNARPPYRITKPANWEFTKGSDTDIFLADDDDPDTGWVSVDTWRTPLELGRKRIIPYVRRGQLYSGDLTMTEITRQQPVTIGGVNGLQVRTSKLGQLTNAYYLPVGQYLYTVRYGFGKEEKDRATVEEAIQSLRFETLALTPGDKELLFEEGKVRLPATASWALQARDDRGRPGSLAHRTIPEAFISVSVDKVDENTRDMSRAEYLTHWKQKLSQLEEAMKITNATYSIKRSSARFAAGPKAKNAVMIEGTLARKGDGQVALYGRDLWFRLPDRYVNISLEVLSADPKVQRQALKDFEKLLRGLVVKR